ncbi:hypothetical protein IAU60_003123 [Kwoniella sp. DSM 27419]
MTDTTPSKIPVAINKRSSVSSSSLMQPSLSSTSLSNLPNSRSQSPLSGHSGSSKAAPANGRVSPVVGSRRPSLLSGGPGPGSRKTSFSEGIGMTLSGSGSLDSTSHDPGQLKAHIAMLQKALQSAQRRLLDVQNGDTSSLPLTPVDGLISLPEVEVDLLGSPHRLHPELGPSGPESPLDPALPRVGSPSHGPKAKIPHSNPSFDLRSRAITPARPLINKVDGRSRIPQAVVAGAAALHPTPPSRSPAREHAASSSPSSADTRDLRSPFLAPESPQAGFPFDTVLGLGSSTDGRLSPAPGLSPGLRRTSGVTGSAASTRVIDGLQTELLNTRGHLERVKQEVRSCQRVIGSLTRQTEDLKETRERMRVECEGLNNVISRKERLLQEVLERARTAEAGLASHQSTRKALEQSTKKSLQHMMTQLTEAQAGQAKAERECAALRDSVRSLRDVWAREVKSVREESRRGEEKGKKDREEAQQRHLALVKLVQAQAADRASVQALADEAVRKSGIASEALQTQIADLRSEIDKSVEESRLAKSQAEELAGELVRLRRLMREPERGSLTDAAVTSTGDLAAIAIGRHN